MNILFTWYLRNIFYLGRRIKMLISLRTLPQLFTLILFFCGLNLRSCLYDRSTVRLYLLAIIIFTLCRTHIKIKITKLSNYYRTTQRTIYRWNCVRERGIVVFDVGVILIKALYITTSCAYVAWGWLYGCGSIVALTII